MLKFVPDFIDSLSPSSDLRRDHPLHRLGVALVAVVFVLSATLIVAFDSIFQTQNSVSLLEVGSIAGEDIRAPASITYVSDVLTDRQRQAAITGVSPIYDPPDPTVARQQITLLQQILDFIDNVRRDPYATATQKAADLNKITAVRLDQDSIDGLLQMDEDTWRSVNSEAVNVLERVMRESIRESDLPLMTDQLPSQVALRFDTRTASVIVALVRDLLRPNRFLNPAATALAQQTAADNVAPESRSFERGQIVVRAGTRLDPVDYEALDHLGLLASPDRRLQNIGRAFLASLVVTVVMGLYLVRIRDRYYVQARFLAVQGGIFLFSLALARLFGGQYVLYPSAAMALTLVVITRNEVAVISTIALGLLVGIMADTSLEIAMMITVGGIIGTLLLRRSERVNNYFFVGLAIAVANV
ncbi:MAG: hypothetical protein U0521_24775, partial [Anaerolineae bacterium]